MQSRHIGGLSQGTYDMTAGGDPTLTDITVTPVDTITPGFSMMDGSMTDLTSSDLSVASPSLPSLSATSSVASISDPSSTLVAGGAMSNIFSNILSAVGVGAAQAAGSVASGYINTAALQATNAQRMSVGLPPINANGQVMSQAQMLAAGYSPQKVSQFGPQLSGSFSPILLAVLGLGAVLLLAGKRS
jgi:hypothetical protein